MVDIAKILGFYSPERRKNSEVRKRVGRGRGSGLGKTCGKGGKGQTARSGWSLVAGFEGGQTPLYRRMPRHGFNNYTRVNYKAIKLETIMHYINKGSFGDKKNIKISDLISIGLIKKTARAKILSSPGDFATGITIEAHAFSASAKKIIEEKGGKVIIVEGYSSEEKAINDSVEEVLVKEETPKKQKKASENDLKVEKEIKEAPKKVAKVAKKEVPVVEENKATVEPKRRSTKAKKAPETTEEQQ